MVGNLYVLCGVPASGKTSFGKSYAKEHDMAYVSRDEVRYTLIEDKEHYFDREDEVYREFTNRIIMNIMNGKSVIADATHLNPKSRNKLLTYVFKKVQPNSVSAIVINTPFAVCFDRNSKREGLTRVPDNQMYRMRNLYKVPTYNEPFDNIFVVENGILMGRVKGQRRK